MKRLIWAVAFLQLGSGKTVNIEPAKTAVAYPIPAKCDRLTVEYSSRGYMIAAAGAGDTNNVSVHRPVRILCEADPY